MGGRASTALTNIGAKLPLKLQVGAYHNVLRQTGGGTWQLLTEAALVF